MSQVAEFLGDNAWAATAALALVAVVAALLLHRVLGALFRRTLAGHAPVLRAILQAGEPAAAAVLPLLALQFVWSSAPSDLHLLQTVRHVNVVLLVAAATWFGMRVVAGVADGVIAQHPTDVADNLEARRIETQARVLSRSAQTLVLICGAALVLMTFPGARQLGASLLASAGVIGIVGGLAARPVFSNLIAGLQIALAQPLRMGDVLIVKGEWGVVEEITGTYVVFRIWDDRRLIVPLSWFIENPFENWTRTSSQLLGFVMLHLDYTTPMEPLRDFARKVTESAPEWDRRVFVVQVVEATQEVMQVRILVSAGTAGKLFDLRCRVREEVIAWLAREHPQSLPRVRQINESGPP